MDLHLKQPPPRSRVEPCEQAGRPLPWLSNLTGIPRGFSLVEQVAVVGISLILAASAIPSFARRVMAARIDGASSALADAMRQARQEAMMSGAPTLLCPGELRTTCKGGNWASGWFGAYAPSWPTRALGEPFLVGEAVGMHVLASSGRAHVRFHTDGSARETNQTLTVCIRGSARGAQTVIVALNGRIRQVKATATNAARCAKA